MTIAERNNKLKHFITCLKCEVSGKCCDDNCSTQYDAGNMGEIIENLEAISKALEQEPKTGHWVKYARPRCGEQHYKCTNCEEYFNFGLYSDYYKRAFKYCPNCGAKMVDPQESEVKE